MRSYHEFYGLFGRYQQLRMVVWQDYKRNRKGNHLDYFDTIMFREGVEKLIKLANNLNELYEPILLAYKQKKISKDKYKNFLFYYRLIISNPQAFDGEIGKNKKLKRDLAVHCKKK